MGALALLVYDEPHDREIETYLCQDNKYWLTHDIWRFHDKVLKDKDLHIAGVKNGILLDFSTFKDERLKNQAKQALM